MNKKVYIIIGVLIVVLVGAVIWKKKYAQGLTKVFTEKIESRNIVETVSANGKIQPEKEVKISSEVPGEIISMTVHEGSVVQKDQLLLEINPDILTASVDRMEAALNSSRANYSNAKARLTQSKARYNQSKIVFDRNKKLLKDGAISVAEFDQASSSLEVSEAEVEAAEESAKAAAFSVKSSEASLKESKDNLNRTKIYAPISGTIYNLNVEAGEKVVGTAQMAGTEMLRIADLNRMEVNVEVSESDIVRVSLGDSADIEIDAYLDRVFKGMVTEISNSANNQLGSSEQVTSFDVRIRILSSGYSDLLEGKDSSYSPFRPGMSAQVEIKTKRINDVISVPIQSVTLRPDSFPKGILLSTIERDEMKECLFLYKDGKVERIMVETGIQDENYIQIVSPILEGEVVKGPYSTIARKLRDGDEVESVNEDQFKRSDD